jgi:3-hydroxybutyryl-CoA dehydrogenase
MTDQGSDFSDQASPILPGTTVGIVGAGTMGSGIAQVAAAAGHPVKIYDPQPGAIERALASVEAGLRRHKRSANFPEQEVLAIQSRLAPVDGLDELAGAGLVIEAISENLDAKRALFRDLEKVVSADCILATNTSALSVTELAASLSRPERLIGMHFFNPAPVMELVEVISGLATDPELAAKAAATARAWNKTPVHARSTPGFIANRVARPFYAEALRLMSEQAADPASLDELVREAGGFRMGPFELMDLIGNDINFAVTQSVFHASFCDSRFAPSLIQQELVQAGFLGRKSGRGFYRYGPGSHRPLPSFEPQRPPPEKISFSNPPPFAELLSGRLQAQFPHAALSSASANSYQIATADSAALFLTDGKTASQLGYELDLANVVLVDLAYDYSRARTLGITLSDRCSEPAYSSAVGLLQAAGFNIISLADLPGLAVMRIVTMIVNEGADAVHYGVGNRSDIDLATRKGLNYPVGPFAWAAKLGTATVYRVLQNIATHYGESRYRTSPLIKYSFWSGRDEPAN